MEHLEFLEKQSKASHDAFEEMEKTYEGFDINIEANLFVDPGTVAAAVETGLKIYSLFKKSSNNDKLIKYLRAQFKEIKQLLNTVLSRLDELKVAITEEARRTAVIDLESNVRIFSESYDDWFSNRSNPDVREKVEDELSNLRNFVNRCEDRGYAHYDTIWVAIIYQIAAMDLLDYNEDVIRNILTNHIDLYFEDARNPVLAGSITYQRNHKALEIKKLGQKCPAFTHKNVIYETEGCTDYVYEQHLTITGDIVKGFKIDLSARKLVDRFRDCGRNDHSPSIIGGDAENDSKGLFSNMNFQATIAKYEAAHAMYKKKLEPELLTLIEATKAVNKYIAILKRHIEDNSITTINTTEVLLGVGEN